MPLVAVSFSHQNTPFDLLGRIALGEPNVPQLLRRLREQPGMSEVVCLSTCNRTEVFCETAEPDRAEGCVFAAISEMRNIDSTHLARHAVVMEGLDARRHLLETAAGIRSLIVGELEILGQVRRAIEVAEAEGTAGRELGALFHRAIQMGRRARSETGISRGNVSVASVAIGKIRDELHDLRGCRALVIGTGEVGSKVLHLLNDSGVAAMMLVNRTAEKAHTLAQQMGCTPIPMERMVEAMAGADIVVCAVGAPHYIVRTEMVRTPAPTAGCRILVDLSAPPNIDPAVAQVPGNVLFTIADLQDIAGRNSSMRQQEIRHVEEMIEQEMNRMEHEPEMRAREQLIRDFRVAAEAIRSRHVQHGARRFPPECHQQLERYSRSLVSAILHGIVKNLDRMAIDSPDAEHELEIARKLLLQQMEETAVAAE